MASRRKANSVSPATSDFGPHASVTPQDSSWSCTDTPEDFIRASRAFAIRFLTLASLADITFGLVALAVTFGQTHSMVATVAGAALVPLALGLVVLNLGAPRHVRDDPAWVLALWRPRLHRAALETVGAPGWLSAARWFGYALVMGVCIVARIV